MRPLPPCTDWLRYAHVGLLGVGGDVVPRTQHDTLGAMRALLVQGVAQSSGALFRSMGPICSGAIYAFALSNGLTWPAFMLVSLLYFTMYVSLWFTRAV
jgi:hypothetical protein